MSIGKLKKIQLVRYSTPRPAGSEFLKKHTGARGRGTRGLLQRFRLDPSGPMSGAAGEVVGMPDTAPRLSETAAVIESDLVSAEPQCSVELNTICFGGL